MDEAGRFTAEHTVMEAGMEIRELKHLLKVAEDKIETLENEIAELKKQPKVDEALHSVASEKYNDFGITFSDKSQLDTDDDPNNKETF
tara:strand:- start:49 stop:312 length:264 start_codon:yes stop_codon:yes gene_type:complete